jgi:thymidylate kinase
MPSPLHSRSKVAVLALIENLVRRLEQSDTKYCHWKSNMELREVLETGGELDFLVHPHSRDAFLSALRELRFREASQPSWATTKAVRHYYGIDAPSGRIVHLHVYFHLITAGSLLKNYHFPAEEALCESNHKQCGIPVPARGHELALLVIRKTIEHGSLIERLLVRREMDAIRREIAWLLQGPEAQVSAICAEAEGFISHWLPTVSIDDFQKALAALRSCDTPWAFRIAARVRRQLHPYALTGPLTARMQVFYRLFRTWWRRRLKKRPIRVLSFYGKIIAVIGPEASGKSTITESLRNWLGEHIDTRMVHAGNPPSTSLSFVPNLLLPWLRKLLPQSRPSAIRGETGNPAASVSESTERRPVAKLLPALRAAILAYDRFRLLTAAFRQAARGAIVICDRYPTRELRAIDSRQLDAADPPIKRSWCKQRLAKCESFFYLGIPQPDLVIRLTVPVDEAIRRNRERNKPNAEGEGYVRMRHAQAAQLRYPLSETITFDTGVPFDELIISIKRAVWDRL